MVQQARLRHRLLGVLLCDASAVAVLWTVAATTRSRPSGPGWAAVARAGTASLLPGIVAVSLEQRAHRAGTTARHPMGPSVVLLVIGLVVNTVGTLLALGTAGAARPGGRRVRGADLALLVGGDVIGLPYLLLIRALHR